jgi:hypothetical protein
MCVICYKTWDLRMDSLVTCPNAMEIPSEMTELIFLYAQSANIIKIPATLTKLRHVDISGSGICCIPPELINLEYLDCKGSRVCDLPTTLTKLSILHCDRIAKIPSELINLAHSTLSLWNISGIHGIKYFYNDSSKFYHGYLRSGNLLISNIVAHNIVALIKFQRIFRLRQKMRTLWKIAEYYTARKYAPNNALRYISLDL